MLTMTPPGIEHLQAKQYSWPGIADQAATWKANGQRIVFTNGCFDLLHKGHIHYLSQAADYGERLIIGVNSDASVSRLKGDQRPIQDASSRTLILAALAMTDAVVVFEEDNPARLIEALTPDILVKGGDYTPEQVVGADQVRSAGGAVYCIPFLAGYSTSNLARSLGHG